MKNIVLRGAGFIAALLLASGTFSSVSAQSGRGQFRGEGRPPVNANRIENIKLTDDQQKQMTGLRVQFQEETVKTNNLIKEKQAHLKTLIDTDNRDMKDLDKTVADLTTLKGDLIKKGIAHRDAVKKILTPEQMKTWENRVRQHMRGGAQGPVNRGMRGGGRMMREGDRPMRGGGRMMGDR
jgi:Spy/CpxP family protein refolding chaperone